MTKFIKNISIYVFGYIFLRAISFLLLPLYTDLFSTSEFGVFSLIFIFIAFCQYFYSYGMDASLMKFYAKDKNHLKMYSSIFISLFFTSTFFSFLLYVFSHQISFLLLGSYDYGYFFRIATLILFFDSFSFRVLIIHRMEDQPFRYFLFAFTNVLIALTLNYYFLKTLNYGVLGSLYSQLCASIVLFVFSLPILLNRISIKEFSFSYLKKIILFGLPFLPSVLFQLIIDFSDRKLLLYFTDMETVGLYSSSYKVASIMLFLIAGFRLGWEPYFLKLEKNRSAIISNLSHIIILIFLSVLLFNTLFINDIIINSNYFLSFSLIGENFWSSLPIVPIIMFGYVFLLFYYLQMPAIYYFNKTAKLPFFRFLGAITNIIMNIILIPFWGVYGAAIATSFSFAIMTIPFFFYCNRLLKIEYDWNMIGLYLFYILIIYFFKINYSIYLPFSLFLFFIAIGMVVYKIYNHYFVLLKK